MSRYGSINVTGPASLLTRIVQSAEPDDLAAKVNAAVAALPGGYVVVGLTLAGAGDGHTFTVTVEAGATADVTGGFTAPPTVACFLASEAEAMQIARAAAGPTSGPFADTQVAGSSKGTRFMGLVVTGDVVAGGGGAAAAPWTVLKIVDVGTTVPVPQQNGSADFPYGTIQAAVDAGATRLMLVGGPSAENVVVPGGELMITVADFMALPPAIASITFSAPGIFLAQLVGRIGSITMPNGSGVGALNCQNIGTITLGDGAGASLEGTSVTTFVAGDSCSLTTDRDVGSATFGTTGILMIAGPDPRSNSAGVSVCTLGDVTMPGISTLIGANLIFGSGNTLTTGGYIELTASQVDGDITCDLLVLRSCFKFTGNVTCSGFSFFGSRIITSTITSLLAGFTELVNTRCDAGVAFVNVPAPASFLLDGYSNYWIKSLGVPIAGSPASKVITDDLIP